MFFKDTKNICDLYNNNPSYKNFITALYSNPDYRNLNKCKYCGNEIYYTNIKFKGPRHKYPVFSKGTTPLSYKTINGIKYNICVCEKCLSSKYPEILSKNKSKLFNMPNKYAAYAFDIPDNIIKTKNNELCIRSLDSFISKYGNKIGQEKFKAYCDKQAYTNTYEYKHKKYGISKSEFDEYNKSRACTLENFIKRHGEIEGINKWNEYCKRQAYTNTREYFIKTYGDKPGLEKWNKFNNARFIRMSYSKISQEFFDNLIKNELFKSHEIYYATLNYEYEIISSEHLYYLDFYDKTLNICVEFNGEAFHPNPKKYKPTDLFRTPYNPNLKPAKEWFNKETNRYNDLYENFNIKTIVIYESDYKKDKNLCITKTINQIYDIIYTKFK